MTVNTYDGTTGKSETKQYSKYYDAGGWIITNKLGMSIVVDHEKKSIPIVHGLQQSLGALGPSDLEASGKVTVYVWNFTDNKCSIVLTKITSRNNDIDFSFPAQAIEPQDRPGFEVGQIPISNYGLQIPITIYYQIDGTPGFLSLNLDRRTYDDLKKYFGDDGQPPYPWYN
jgi:hypothetical protein